MRPRLPPRLLGREICGASKNHPRRGPFCFQHAARQAKVGEFDVPNVGKQNIWRRDVPVNKLQLLMGVDVGQSPPHLAHNMQSDIQRDTLANPNAPVPDLAEILAFDQFHGDVELAVHVPSVKVPTNAEWFKRNTTLASSKNRLALESSVFSGIIFLITQSFSKPPMSPLAAK